MPDGSSEMNVCCALTVDELVRTAFTGAGAVEAVEAIEAIETSVKELTAMGRGVGVGTCHVMDSSPCLLEKEIKEKTRVKTTAIPAIFNRRCCKRPMLDVHGSRHNGIGVFAVERKEDR